MLTASPPSTVTSLRAPARLGYRLALASAGLACLLGQGGPARAQAEAAPSDTTQTASPEAPPEQAPLPPPPPRANQPGGYGHGGYGQPGYAQPGSYGQPNPYAMPPYQQPWDGITRPFSLSLGIGPGALIEPHKFGGDSRLGYQHTFRLAFEFAPRWSFYLAWEGIGVSATVDVSDTLTEAAWWRLHSYVLGLQHFVTSRLHLRGGFGFASLGVSSSSIEEYDDRGVALAAAAGYDVVQGDNFAVSAEMAGTSVHFPGQRWNMLGLQLVLSFF